MGRPHAHVPFGALKNHIGFIRDNHLNLEIYFGGRDLDGLSASDLDELKGLLDYGAAITVHGPFMDLSPGAVDEKIREITRLRFSQVFDVAAVLGPRAVVFHSGYEKWKYAHNVNVWLEGCIRTWPEFIERAAAIGTRIAIENIFEDEPSSLEALMGELGSEHFGICFDTGHFNLFSALPLSMWLEGLGPRIIEVHLHDNRGDEDSHLAIGDGTFDFKGLFGALEGRDIIYTIEAHTPEDLVKSIRRIEGDFTGSRGGFPSQTP